MKALRKVATTALGLTLGIVLAGCGQNDGGSSAGATAPGVAADKIVLGQLTDLTGVWGPSGKMYLSGVQLWVDWVNGQDGGVCKRKIELLVRDHKSNPQDAVTIYKEMEPQIFEMTAILGSGPVLQVAPQLAKDKVVSSTYAWDQMILETSPNVFLPGATYDVAAANLTDWAVKKFNIQKGDTIGLVRYDGIFEGVKNSMTAAAKEYGLKFVEQTVQFTDSDFTGPASTIKNSNAKFVMIALSAAHTGAFVSTAASLGYTPEYSSPSPGNFEKSLLNGPAKDILQKHYWWGTSYAGWNEKLEGTDVVHQAFDKYGKGDPTYAIMLGFAQGEVFGQLLKQTCDSGDLTRERFLEFFQKTQKMSTGGVMTDLDFTRGAGKSQSLQTGIWQPDANQPTGFREVEPYFTSPLVEKLGY
jgi:ABC-type branched-subunit amino acid transport system substrate-binding protein